MYDIAAACAYVMGLLGNEFLAAGTTLCPLMLTWVRV